MLPTFAKASRVCNTKGLPANMAYCLGPWVRARLPVPAHGIKAQNLGTKDAGSVAVGLLAMVVEATVLNGVSQIEGHKLIGLFGS